MTTNTHIEIEIKIRVSDLHILKQKILGSGFTVISPYCFEYNVVLDTQDQKLKNHRLLLRLRKIEGRNILTFKRPTAKESDSTDYKVREEIEVDVADFDTALTIFKGLGYEVFFIYEKYREIYDNGSVKIMLDHTPIGDFMEIEGTAEEIDKTAISLGYSKADYLTENYLALFRQTHETGFMQFHD